MLNVIWSIINVCVYVSLWLYVFKFVCVWLVFFCYFSFRYICLFVVRFPNVVLRLTMLRYVRLELITFLSLRLVLARVG